MDTDETPTQVPEHLICRPGDTYDEVYAKVSQSMLLYGEAVGVSEEKE